MVVVNEITINDNGLYQTYSYLVPVLEGGLQYLHIDNVVFSIIFVSDEEIHEMNRTYRGVDRVTDVISFAFEDNGQMEYNGCRLLGDIYISIDQMKRQAKEYGHSEKRELSFLAVHGMLHLLGYDHMEKEEEQEMFALQELILDAANIKREN